MVSMEMIIVIAQICLSNGNSPQVVAESVKCNQQIVSCVEQTYHKQFIKDQLTAFNSCHIKYELEK